MAIVTHFLFEEDIFTLECMDIEFEFSDHEPKIIKHCTHLNFKTKIMITGKIDSKDHLIELLFSNQVPMPLAKRIIQKYNEQTKETESLKNETKGLPHKNCDPLEMIYDSMDVEQALRDQEEDELFT